MSFSSKCFVLQPTHEAYEKSLIVSGLTQKMHPLISKKIEEVVGEGSTDSVEVQRVLKGYVRNQCSTSKSDRAYYPTAADMCKVEN